MLLFFFLLYPLSSLLVGMVVTWCFGKGMLVLWDYRLAYLPYLHTYLSCLAGERRLGRFVGGKEWKFFGTSRLVLFVSRC